MRQFFHVFSKPQGMSIDSTGPARIYQSIPDTIVQLPFFPTSGSIESRGVSTGLMKITARPRIGRTPRQLIRETR
jgi:hypothetical protein